MATFSRHEPCTKCGSRDNLARYSDGSCYCFGCGYTERANRYVPPTPEDEDYENEEKLILPKDVTPHIGTAGADWLAKYGITKTEQIKYRMLWSPSKEQLIFPLYKKDGTLAAWQARNFRQYTKVKYLSHGKIHDLLYPIGKKSDTIFLTEDLLSAIKIGREYWAMPLWGSEASTPLLMRLKTIAKGIVVWLDSDKWKNGHDITNRARSIGLEAYCMFSVLDPKEYRNDQINKLINS